MIEFVLKDRRLRLYPDGVIRCRAIIKGVETKTDTWHIIKFCENGKEYLRCNITVEGVAKQFTKHRLLHLAHNPSWDIFDNSPNNCIDHINRNRVDNSNENLRVVTNQQNQFNRSNTKGYAWNKATKKWTAQIGVNNKIKYLGYFDNEEDARASYLKAKAELHIMSN